MVFVELALDFGPKVHVVLSRPVDDDGVLSVWPERHREVDGALYPEPSLQSGDAVVLSADLPERRRGRDYGRITEQDSIVARKHHGAHPLRDDHVDVATRVLVLQVLPRHSERVRTGQPSGVDRFFVNLYGIRTGRSNGFVEGDVELASGWSKLTGLMQKQNPFGRQWFDRLRASWQLRDRQACEHAQNDASGF
jgi:hypothetical protein